MYKKISFNQLSTKQLSVNQKQLEFFEGYSIPYGQLLEKIVFNEPISDKSDRIGKDERKIRFDNLLKNFLSQDELTEPLAELFLSLVEDVRDFEEQISTIQEFLRFPPDQRTKQLVFQIITLSQLDDVSMPEAIDILLKFKSKYRSNDFVFTIKKILKPIKSYETRISIIQIISSLAFEKFKIGQVNDNKLDDSLSKLDFPLNQPVPFSSDEFKQARDYYGLNNITDYLKKIQKILEGISEEKKQALLYKIVSFEESELSVELINRLKFEFLAIDRNKLTIYALDALFDYQSSQLTSEIISDVLDDTYNQLEQMTNFEINKYEDQIDYKRIDKFLSQIIPFISGVRSENYQIEIVKAFLLLPHSELEKDQMVEIMNSLKNDDTDFNSLIALINSFKKFPFDIFDSIKYKLFKLMKAFNEVYKRSEILQQFCDLHKTDQTDLFLDQFFSFIKIFSYDLVMDNSFQRSEISKSEYPKILQLLSNIDFKYRNSFIHEISFFSKIESDPFRFCELYATIPVDKRCEDLAKKINLLIKGISDFYEVQELLSDPLNNILCEDYRYIAKLISIVRTEERIGIIELYNDFNQDELNDKDFPDQLLTLCKGGSKDHCLSLIGVYRSESKHKDRDINLVKNISFLLSFFSSIDDKLTIINYSSKNKENLARLISYLKNDTETFTKKHDVYKLVYIQKCLESGLDVANYQGVDSFTNIHGTAYFSKITREEAQLNATISLKEYVYQNGFKQVDTEKLLNNIKFHLDTYKALNESDQKKVEAATYVLYGEKKTEEFESILKLDNDQYRLCNNIFSGKESLVWIWFALLKLNKNNDHVDLKWSFVTALAENFEDEERKCPKGLLQRLLVGVLQGRLEGVDIDGTLSISNENNPEISTDLHLKIFFENKKAKTNNKEGFKKLVAKYMKENSSLDRDEFLKGLQLQYVSQFGEDLTFDDLNFDDVNYTYPEYNYFEGFGRQISNKEIIRTELLSKYASDFKTHSIQNDGSVMNDSSDGSVMNDSSDGSEMNDSSDGSEINDSSDSSEIIDDISIDGSKINDSSDSSEIIDDISIDGSKINDINSINNLESDDDIDSKPDIRSFTDFSIINNTEKTFYNIFTSIVTALSFFLKILSSLKFDRVDENRSSKRTPRHRTLWDFYHKDLIRYLTSRSESLEIENLDRYNHEALIQYLRRTPRRQSVWGDEKSLDNTFQREQTLANRIDARRWPHKSLKDKLKKILDTFQENTIVFISRDISAEEKFNYDVYYYQMIELYRNYFKFFDNYEQTKQFSDHIRIYELVYTLSDYKDRIEMKSFYNELPEIHKSNFFISQISFLTDSIDSFDHRKKVIKTFIKTPSFAKEGFYFKQLKMLLESIDDDQKESMLCKFNDLVKSFNDKSQDSNFEIMPFIEDVTLSSDRIAIIKYLGSRLKSGYDIEFLSQALSLISGITDGKQRIDIIKAYLLFDKDIRGKSLVDRLNQLMNQSNNGHFRKIIISEYNRLPNQYQSDQFKTLMDQDLQDIELKFRNYMNKIRELIIDYKLNRSIKSSVNIMKILHQFKCIFNETYFIQTLKKYEDVYFAKILTKILFAIIHDKYFYNILYQKNN